MGDVTVIDIVFGVIIILFVVRCAIKGFITEVLTMASWVLGILAAVLFFETGAALIRTSLLPSLRDIQVLPEIMAFAAIFIIIFIVFKIIAGILKGILEGIRLGGLDLFLGIVFGLIEGAAVVGLILFVLTIQPLFNVSSLLNNSFFARFLLPMLPGLPGGAGMVLTIIPKSGV
ncbi:MAG: CvpA family protein [Treponema sp.]|jgi:membrane protein required for colicin V production|nr:CvpA family protein [Treponema sp.]